MTALAAGLVLLATGCSNDSERSAAGASMAASAQAVGASPATSNAAAASAPSASLPPSLASPLTAVKPQEVQGAQGKKELKACFINGFTSAITVLAYTAWDEPSRNLEPGASTCFGVEFTPAREDPRARFATFAFSTPGGSNVSTSVFAAKPTPDAYTVYNCWKATCTNKDPVSQSVMKVGDVTSVSYGNLVLDMSRGADAQEWKSFEMEVRPKG